METFTHFDFYLRLISPENESQKKLVPMNNFSSLIGVDFWVRGRQTKWSILGVLAKRSEIKTTKSNNSFSGFQMQLFHNRKATQPTPLPNHRPHQR